MNAKLIQDVLNGHGLVFRITDERIKETTYEKSNDVVGVLETMPGGYLYNEVGNRILTMQIEFAGANKDFESFREIVKDYFPNDELIGDTWIYSQPLEFTDFADNEGHKKFNARIVFQVVEVVGGVSGKSTTIKVDGVEIDFTNVLYRQDKSLLPTKAFGNNKEVRMVSELLSIKIPMSDNTKNIELIMAGADNSYNKSYLVEWNIGGIKKTFDAVMRVGISEYSKTYEPLLWTLTFERALPREEWGVSVFKTIEYWDVTTDFKPSNVTYNEEITTEADFRTFLDTLDIEEIGYVVRNEYIENKYWGSFGTIKHYKYVGLANGSEQNTVSMNSDDDPLEWITAVYNPNNYSVGTTFRVIDSQYGGSYRFIVEIYGSSVPIAVYDGLDVVVATSEAQTTYSFAVNRLDTAFGNITQQDYVAAFRIESREFEFKYRTNDPFDTTDDNIEDSSIDSPATFMHFLRNTPMLTPYARPIGQRVGGTKDGTGRKYIAEVVAKNVWYFFKQEVDGYVFYGQLKESQYTFPLNAPVIDYSAKHSVETTTRWKDGKIIGDPAFYGNGFVVLFLITEVTQQFIDDLYEQAGNHYKITFKINNKTYNYEDLIITDIERQNSENASQVMQVTFAEGGRL